MKKYLKPIGAMAVIFLLCASAHILTKNSETLLDYAQKQPEIAYPEQTSQEEITPMQNTEAETITVESCTTEAPVPETIDTEATKPQTPAESARITYQPNFYYEPLSEDIKKRITGLSYKKDCPIPYDELRYVSVQYINFKGNSSTGELICNKAIAQDLVEIFYKLYEADYQIEQIRLVDEYGADDNLSMQDNNTSCFNYRTIAGTDKISMHGQGLAIDINPFFNPYITYRDGGTQVAPAGAEAYADRSKPFAYKIDENDLCYRLFTEYGFTWGGHWNSSKDYQHFEKDVK